MKVAMITGSYPPDICGVGDNTSKLVTALQKQGICVEVITKFNWNLSQVYNILKYVKSIEPDIIHIQYPTVGYGFSLVPQLLSMLMKPVIVTIHEASQVHVLRRISLYPFTFGARHLIFTNEFEMNFVKKMAPWINQKANVIHIGSAISIGGSQDRDLNEIVYFGLIRPQKGLEKVLSLAELIKEKGLNLSIRIIGTVDSRESEYFQNIYSQSKSLPIKWNLGLSDNDVADLLSRSKLAYVPYPDGASERRSSLLALLANGVVTITTKGRFTPVKLNETVNFAQSPDEALKIVNNILENKLLMKQLSNNSKNYISDNFSWDIIAKQHCDMYKQLLLINK